MPSEQNTYLGGNIINLINSFCFVFLPQILICLTMQWEMSHFNENTKKSKPRCYFLSSVVLCNFSSFCCLNERKIVVIIFHHQQPLDSLNHHDRHRWIFAASIYFFFKCSVVVVACHFSTYPLADLCSMAAYVISCFRGPHRWETCWNNEGKLRWCCWLCISLL